MSDQQVRLKCTTAIQTPLLGIVDIAGKSNDFHTDGRISIIRLHPAHYYTVVVTQVRKVHGTRTRRIQIRKADAANEIEFEFVKV